MKTLISITIFLISSAYSYSQIYQAFPTSGAMWREYSNGHQCMCCSDYQYTISGDTAINSVVYHKLKKTGVKYFEDNQSYCTQNIQSTINQYSGYFRNDEQNKKIQFISPGDSVESTLYDFNMEIGDTVPPSILNDNGNIYNLVVGIDSVLVDTNYHKQFTISNGGSILYYIEGIGSTYGLLSMTGVQFEYTRRLKCYAVNSQPKYPANTSSCPIASGINEFNSDETIQIFPNPSSGLITVSTPFEGSIIKILNTDGKQFFERHLNSRKNELDLKEYPRGIYIVMFCTETSTVHKKLIIR